MHTFRLAIKLFFRELSQGELSLLFLSLLIATGSLSSIGFLIQRIDHSMVSHASQLNGAQLILKSPSSVSSNWLEKARELKLEQAQMRIFPSMLVHKDEFRLAQIKAVSNNFPLQGELRVRKTLTDEAQLRKAPPAGEIWLDRRLLVFFKLSLDDTVTTDKSNNLIELGEAKFQPSGILERVPGQSSSFFTIAPTALINMDDLAQTATVQPGSRVNYIYFFAGAAEALESYEQWLQPKLRAGQSLRSGIDDLRAVNASLNKAGDFLSLAAILTVLLAAIAIAINSYRYGQNQYKNNAIMLCLGCSEKRILLIELYKLVTLGLVACFIGIVFGYLVYAGLLSIMSDIIPDSRADFYLVPAWVALSCGMLLLLTVSMANLIQLKKLSPMALIRKDIMPEDINTRAFYLLSIVGLLIISFWYTDNFKITALFYLVIFFSAILLYFVARFLLQHIIRLGRRYGVINRLSLLNLQRHSQGILLQITTFSLIFALLILIFLIRTELLDKWQQQFPEQTPNHFVINLQSYETQSFRQHLQQEAIKTEGLYPMVRGRLTHLNQLPVMDVIPESSRQHNALHRELNLSYSDELFPQTDKNKREGGEAARLSIESSLAKAMNIKRGDLLGFQVGANKIQGTVHDIRKVHWDSFQPNFYIIFSPGLIEQYPMTWIGSFYLAKNDKYKLNGLIEKFPGSTIIEVDEILKEVQFIIEKISAAIEIIFLFIISAGALILSSSLTSTMASRLYENAIIRTLGASARQLRHCLLVELSVVALLSAFIAIVLAELATFVLYHQVFHISFALHPEIWLSIALIALLLIGGLGLMVMNRIFTQSTHRSLNQFGGR